jgi:hypothetical protein
MARHHTSRKYQSVYAPTATGSKTEEYIYCGWGIVRAVCGSKTAAKQDNGRQCVSARSNGRAEVQDRTVVRKCKKGSWFEP